MSVRALGMVLDGIDAHEVILEAKRSETLRPGEVMVVGLPGAAVREGIQRARAGIWNFMSPLERGSRQGILINLSPADLRKRGRSLDLPLAMVYAAVLRGSGGGKLEDLVFLGEVGLAGEVRCVPGVLAVMLTLRRKGRRALVLPAANLEEAQLVPGVELHAVHNVAEALEVLEGRGPATPAPRVRQARADSSLDLSEVQGQHLARRALEVAAAGGHNLVLDGPPGSGKTMLARRLPTILPQLTDAQALETACVQSVVRVLDPAHFRTPPFRSPHHTATPAGLAGGGNPVRPGEFSLAHNGVLFLDEFAEFDRRALEVLREPLEERKVHVTRASGVREFPADFLCLAAMNPCPCGYHGLDDGRCRCTPRRISTYRERLSGPLLDRFDLRVFVRPVPAEDLLRDGGGEASCVVAERVARARAVQEARFGEAGLNSRVRDRDIRRAADYGQAERQLLLRLVAHHRLSARAARRLERVARTVADLAQDTRVSEPHLMEALGFRLGGELEIAGAAGA